MSNNGLGRLAKGLAVASAATLTTLSAQAVDKAVLDKWLKEFSPSTLTPAQQTAELEWFAKVGEQFKGKTLRIASEQLTIHKYEQETLAQAFLDLTGVRVIHSTIPEGQVVDNVMSQLDTGTGNTDMFVNDSDLIGTHYRYGKTLNLTEFMAGAGKDVTSPTLDLKDFIGTSFTTGPDGQLYQLPDQQFANLYWFRADWFERPELKKKFKDKFGYELGVPINWSAYEDIADFFTNDVKEIDGQKVYGHMDYGKKNPSLGWRFTDAWLSMAGEGSKGYPNGDPVDEWGIRAEKCVPVGATVARGGGTNSPAGVYALTKYIDWMKKYAPPDAIGMEFGEAGPVPAKGNIAQQIFWYTVFTADMNKPGLPINNADGTPKWRMAPSPHGPYWEPGMQRGYQDVGAWTIIKSVPLETQKLAWLYAQFATSKTVSLKKSVVSLSFIRDSDIRSETMTKMAPNLGGLIEFYRSPARVAWTPTGTNVPDYGKLARLWWLNVADAVQGLKTPQQAMDNLAEQMEEVMGGLKDQKKCQVALGEKKGADYWLGRPDGPKKKLDNEKPKGETVSYAQLLKTWTTGKDISVK